MRLAHLADLHLGFRQFHRLTERGHNQRESDVATAFASAIDGVIAAAPDIVLIAGDLFHAVRPTNSAILHAVRQLRRLDRELPGVPVVVIAGNHDTPRSSDTTSIFGLLHEIGVRVATDRAQRMEFADLDLSVLAVPHEALFASPRIAIEPAGPARHQVLLIHGEVPGLFPDTAAGWEPDGGRIEAADLSAGWTYVALGHYHVQHEVATRQWYAGSLDYVSTNPWGELRDERNGPGKGWLLVDLDTGKVERRAIASPRRFLDLPWLDALDMTASEVDRLLAGAVSGIAGGIDGAVVRQVVRNVPRAVSRQLDHAQIRIWKASALHFQLDLRRPEPLVHRVGSGAPGQRRTLPQLLGEFLADRTLPPGVDQSRFVDRGLEFLEAGRAGGVE